MLYFPRDVYHAELSKWVRFPFVRLSASGTKASRDQTGSVLCIRGDEIGARPSRRPVTTWRTDGSAHLNQGILCICAVAGALGGAVKAKLSDGLAVSFFMTLSLVWTYFELSHYVSSIFPIQALVFFSGDVTTNAGMKFLFFPKMSPSLAVCVVWESSRDGEPRLDGSASFPSSWASDSCLCVPRNLSIRCVTGVSGQTPRHGE